MFRDRLKPVTVSTCRHRSAVSTGQDGREIATCSLLRAAIAAQDDVWHRVGRDACEACCGHFPPSRARPNPVVAALIHEASIAVERAGGVDGCSVVQAQAVRERVLADLEVDEPDKGSAASAPAGTAASGSLPGPPARRSGTRVRRWAVGVTTAPRRLETLGRTLESLTSGGWPDPSLFIDSAVTLPGRFAHLRITFRDTAQGAWPNYYLTLAELLLRSPDADALLVAQDDIVFPHGINIRAYLEEMLWPGKKPGLVSLYCSSAYTKPEAGWYQHRGLWFWGALAFVFPSELAREFVLDRRVFDHRRAPLNNGLANIDMVIGAWALRRGVGVWHPTPSLVQHIGERSTIWTSSTNEGPRRADAFAGDPP